jgi:hypothetical protein
MKDSVSTLPVRAIAYNPKDKLLAKIEALKAGLIFDVLGEVKMASNPTYSDDLIIKDINPKEEELSVSDVPNDSVPF